jgi:hypothetical protein
MSTRLILVCKEGDARQAYIRDSETTNTEIDVASDFHELLQAMTHTAYNGIVIDIVTSIKASKEEKQLAHDLFQVFPVVQAKWDRLNDSIRTISSGKTIGGAPLTEFIAAECVHFSPRTIRSNDRRSITFNVLFGSAESSNDNSLIKTVTINISKGGCFLYSSDNWTGSDNVRLIINELRDKTPIISVIRWSVEWGKAMVMPGIGMEFKCINEDQIQELSTRYLLS